MAMNFPVQPIGRFVGDSKPVKRPKEFTCFSYDEKHEFHLGDGSMRWYYPPELGADLSAGFDTFDKLDDSGDEHLVGLLKAIIGHEGETGKKIDAQVVTWRGMMTKILAAPFEDRDGFEMNVSLFEDCLYIEEHHKFKVESRQQQESQRRRGPINPDVMSYWGYKFETLSTLPRPWGETSRDYIEGRPLEVVSNKAQYCSVVRTGIGKTILCLGGEVDAIWDSKPTKQGAPVNWVELKTSVEIRGEKDLENFHRKLMKFWIQSFLLGVPKIVVGFRSPKGILQRLDEIETEKIPDMVSRRERPAWNANMCVNFAAEFLEWLRKAVDNEGLWRIRRRAGSPHIEVFRVEEQGHGEILTDEFINWRIKLSMNSPPKEEA